MPIPHHTFSGILYGVETVPLKKKDLDGLTFAQNSIYVKVFSTFCKEILNQCQFYSGYLSIKYQIKLRLFNFYKNLKMNCDSPASFLFKWFDQNEFNKLCLEYSLNCNMSHNGVKANLWNCLATEIENTWLIDWVNCSVFKLVF